MQNQSREYRIYAGRVGYDVEEEEFQDTFKQFGTVISSIYFEGRGFGFVSYSRRMEAENAIAIMNGQTMSCYPMVVEWANGYNPEERNPPDEWESPNETSDDYERLLACDNYETVYNMTCSNNSIVLCKGLARHTRKETLESVFGAFGIIENIDLCTQHSDYAFVNFNSKEAATLAICSINNTRIDGLRVKCMWSYVPGHPFIPVATQTTPLELSSSSQTTPFEPSSSSDTTTFELSPSSQTTPSESSSSSSSSFPSIDDSEFERVFNEIGPYHRTVYIKGLFPNTPGVLIYEMFKPYGEIEDISLYNEQFDYGFVRFSTKEAATRAICSLDGALLITNNREEPIICSWAFRQDPVPLAQRQSSQSSPQSNSNPISDVLGRSSPQLGLATAAAAPSIEIGNRTSISDELDRINTPVASGTASAAAPLTESNWTSILDELNRINTRLGSGTASAAAGSASLTENNLTSISNELDRINNQVGSGTANAAAPLTGSNRTSISGKLDGINTQVGSGTAAVLDQIDSQLGLCTADAAVTSLPSIESRLTYISQVLNVVINQFGSGTVESEPASAPLTENESQGAAHQSKVKTDLLCKICMDKELGIVFLPCGHLFSCVQCAKRLFLCPVCRKRVTQKIRTYLS